MQSGEAIPQHIDGDMVSKRKERKNLFPQKWERMQERQKAHIPTQVIESKSVNLEDFGMITV